MKRKWKFSLGHGWLTFVALIFSLGHGWLFFVALIFMALAFSALPALAAGGGADYGRGPETDPIATPILSTATTDVATLKGQVSALQGGTDAWNTASSDAAGATTDVATLQGQVLALQGGTDAWNTASSDAAGATTDVAVLKGSVWGSPGITPATNLTTNTVAVQTKNIAGGNLTGYRILHIWMSDSDLGAASTNNIESLTLSTGTAIATVTAKADYWYATAAAGSATAVIVGTAAGTNYIMVADGSTVNSAAVVFE